MRSIAVFGLSLLIACQRSGSAPEPSENRRDTLAAGSASASPSPKGDARFDAELSASAYPYPVATFELATQRQKLRMAYMDVKPSGTANEKTVLLLHGKNFTGAHWRTTIEALASQGYRVIAPDQVGFGKSSKPAGYQFSFQALAENTTALLASLGVPRVSVVGHSMGGMLAVRLALLYPSQVEKLALISPIGLEDWKRAGVPPRSVDDWYEAELKATPDSIREYQKKSYYGGRWTPEYEELIQLAAGSTQHPDYPKVAWCSALLYDMIWNQPIVYELPDVKVPTLLMIGLRDRTAVGSAWASPDVAATLGDYTQLGKRAHAVIPGSRLVELPGVGHVPQVEAFETYSRALSDFLH